MEREGREGRQRLMYICGRYARYVCWTGPDGRHEHGREGGRGRETFGGKKANGRRDGCRRQAGTASRWIGKGMGPVHETGWRRRVRDERLKD